MRLDFIAHICKSPIIDCICGLQGDYPAVYCIPNLTPLLKKLLPPPEKNVFGTVRRSSGGLGGTANYL